MRHNLRISSYGDGDGDCDGDGDGDGDEEGDGIFSVTAPRRALRMIGLTRFHCCCTISCFMIIIIMTLMMMMMLVVVMLEAAKWSALYGWFMWKKSCLRRTVPAAWSMSSGQPAAFSLFSLFSSLSMPWLTLLKHFESCFLDFENGFSNLPRTWCQDVRKDDACIDLVWCGKQG